MRRKDADLVNFASLEEDCVAVWILLGHVADIPVERSVFVFGPPNSTTVVEVVGQKDPNARIESDKRP
jgi:hypothetical protein